MENVETEVLRDLLVHISEVQENISQMILILKNRGISHDKSKFTDIEFNGFVETRLQFKIADYGTKEYQDCIDRIKPSIEHHYSQNRHHTLFHKNGFEDMNFFDILEMLADWRAASNRNINLSFEDSLLIAFNKYCIPKNMQKHIMSTIRTLMWV